MGEIDALFVLLGAAVRQERCRPLGLDAARWWSLFRLAQRGHVAALCYGAAREGGAPREVLMPWLAEHERVADRYRRQCEVQRLVVDTMARHGIGTLVLKGTALAQYWPRSEEREFGDVDLYFYDRHDEADRAAEAELGVRVHPDSHHHTRYALRGITVESHSTLLNTHYPPSNKRYEALLEKFEIRNSKFDNANFELLFLLRHMAGHFAASRITLRDLCDWAFASAAHSEVADWALVQQTVDDSGMGGFVEQLNTLAHDRLGLGAPLPARCHSEWMERDMVYGSRGGDEGPDGLQRLGWKVRRWHANAWKRRLAYSEGDLRLLAASLCSHALKPRGIFHKM